MLTRHSVVVNLAPHPRTLCSAENHRRPGEDLRLPAIVGGTSVWSREASGRR